MNCQEFSEHVTEIARAEVMDAAARDAALAHAEGCAACAARLGRERTLSAALRATAESFNELGAPARVETALLAAFRANRSAPAGPSVVLPFAPAAARGQVGTSAARFGRRARAAFAATAIAASLVIAFVVARRAPQQPEPARQIAAHTPPASPAPASTTQAEATATGAQPSSQTAAGASAGDESERNLDEAVRPSRAARVQRAAGGQSVKKALSEAALAFNIDGGQAVFAEGDAAAASEAAALRGDEAALTDFVPVSAGANSAPLEGGRVVRVEAPRAALASLGLPVDPRRAGETVKADLLLGHDGTAHAIRLVR